MAYTWLILSLLAATSQLTTADVTARFCVTSDPAKAKCEDMKTAFDGANLRQLSCVQASSQYACMRMIKAGQADIMKVNDKDIFAAGKFFGLVPILKESASTDPSVDPVLYKAVIVVRSDSNINSVDALKGKKSCHTGVGKTVGWTVPVSNLQARKVIDIRDCDNTVENVGAFFSQSCAPGAFDAANNIDGDNPASICQICESDRCPSSDKYAGYDGSIQCLLDSRGDVAFAKDSTIGDLTAKNSTIKKDDFTLLCPDGSTKHVDESSTCYWAARPSDSIVTSATLPAGTISDLRNLLDQGSRQFGPESSTFKMFSSDGYDGSNVLFTDSTKQLRGVSNTNYSSYLGEGFLNTFVNYVSCPATDRWCVVSKAEEDKCAEMSGALAAARITSKMSCVRAANHKECMAMIKNGTADLVTLDGGDVYTAGKYQSLVPIMAESYGSSQTTSYWAVAVVKKSKSWLTIDSLKGKTSCHTGIQKTSGWNMPIGTLIEKGQISKADTQCGIIEAVGKFFSKSCVPGALDSKYNPTGSNPTNLCELCGGKQFCKRDNSNKYYSYKGAFRCLVEKDADVAFVKHTTVKDYSDGKLQEDWAKNLKSSDFELLCPDGTRKAVDQWQSCSLARVPSHAVVTSSKKSPADRRHYMMILKKAQLKYGTSSSGFKMFSTSNGQHDAIFDDSTSALSDIMSDQQEYTKFLGKEYTDAVSALDKKACTGGAVGPIATVSYIVTLIVICLRDLS